MVTTLVLQNNNARVRMELEDLLCNGLLEWLQDDEPGFSGDVDLEQLLPAASVVYEQCTDPTHPTSVR